MSPKSTGRRPVPHRALSPLSTGSYKIRQRVGPHARIPGIDILGMSGKLSGMDTVTVRELQKNLKQALIRVQRGATLRVTRRRKVVAQIGPVQTGVAAKPWPDLGARAERVFGKRVLKSGAGDVILSGRGEW